jgi:NADH-quinone oxidoreductase subunit N
MTVVSLYYYLRFIRAMYIDPETQPQPITLAPPLKVGLGIAAVLVIIIGIFPQRFIDLSRKAAVTEGLKTYTYRPGDGQQQSQPAAPVTSGQQ